MSIESNNINEALVLSAIESSTNSVADDVAIRVQNLSKCYHIYDKPHDRLKQFVIPKLYRVIPALSKLFSSSLSLLTTSKGVSTSQAVPVFHKEFWALKDVSFEVKKGETVGIIGCNGSGKSTLLQIICGTLNPTHGYVHANGRIAALLELGSGFNPEFTGRENIYLNAAVLGLTKEEVNSRFDEIAAFAAIGDFIEQPVKLYSSGMVVRLAFSVAINVDPEILIIDEALSVGDELFQRKCFSRIEAIKSKGATILFVSHSGHAVVELCDRAVLIDAGEKMAIGKPKEIVGNYQNLLYAPIEKREGIRVKIRETKECVETVTTKVENASNKRQALTDYDQEMQESFDPHLKSSCVIEYESSGAIIESPRLLTLVGEQVNNLIRGKTYCYTYTVKFTNSASNIQFGMLIKTTAGVVLGGTRSKVPPQKDLIYVEKGTCFRVSFHFRCALNSGVYYLTAGVADSESFLHRLVDVVVFRVMPDNIGYSIGTVDFSGNFDLEHIKL